MRAFAALLLALGLSGCAAAVVQPHAPAASPSIVPAPTLALDAPLSWNGSTLRYDPQSAAGCGADSCETTRFALPGGNATLQVALDWAPTHDASQGDLDVSYPSFNATLLLPNGTTLFQWGGKFGLSLLVPQAPAGSYELVVRIGHWWQPSYLAGSQLPYDDNPAATSASYRGALLIFDPPALPPGPLLPDLVIRDVGQPRIEYSAPPFGNQGSLADPAAPGCTLDEVQETGARRCLRFSVAVGNDGDGPFVLSPKDEQASDFRLGLRSVEAEQCVENADGTGFVRAAGTATYSPSHQHIHYDRILGYDLYTFDPATSQRGERVAKGAKLGYGPFPEALLHLGLRPAGSLGIDVPCKALPDPAGLNAGWYDYYLWWRTSQYIDVAGVPDGVYELVATINPEQHVLESDYANNAGSIVIRLTGDHVDVLRAFVWNG